MPHILLKPQFLGFKNKLIGKGVKEYKLFNQELLVLTCSFFVMLVTYKATYALFKEISENKIFASTLPPKIISLSFLMLFLLLFFSCCISALGFLFHSQDLETMLSLPLSKTRFFVARLCNIVLNSFWMLILFVVPIYLGFCANYGLSLEFLALGVLIISLLLIISASLGSIAVILLVNICPAYRIKEILAMIAVIFAISVLVIGQKTSQVEFSQQLASQTQISSKDHLKSAALFLSATPDPNPEWFPSKWAALTISSYLDPEVKILPPLLKLLSLSAVLFFIALVLFKKLHIRGWSFASLTKSPNKIYTSNLSTKLVRLLIPFNQPLRALVTKEIKCFVRDTTQSLQLFVLLFLTSIYIYNFRALRNFSGFEPEMLTLWKSGLSVANVILGACVVAAIATRFVYPSVSLEGKSYYMIRLTPLSIHEYLKNKFLLWFIPVLSLNLILLISGALAIQSSTSTILATFFVTICLSIGITGIGVGIGSVYSKFDWDSPSQISASFGSLVYMFLALTTIAFSTLPCLMLFALTNIESLKDNLEAPYYFALLLSSTGLIITINYCAARWSLRAGSEKLRELER